MKTPVEEQLAELRAGQRATRQLVGGFVVAVLALMVVGAPMAMAGGLGGPGLKSSGAAVDGADITPNSISISQDQKLSLNGATATKYIKYNSGTGFIEIEGHTNFGTANVLLGTNSALYLDGTGGTKYITYDGTNIVTTGNARTTGDLSATGREYHVVQSVTGTDDGAGTNRAVTVTPSSSYIELTCSDTQGCDITMSETGAVEGSRVCMVSLTGSAGAGENNFADTAGVSETAGAFAAETNDSICMVYTGTTWVEIGRSNN